MSGILKKLKSRHRGRPSSRSQLIAKHAKRKSKSKLGKLARPKTTPCFKPPENVYKSDQQVSEFRGWCEEIGLELHPSLYIGEHGSCHRIGVVASEAIASGECLAVIPRQAILTCSNSSIAQLVQDDEALSNTTSGWVTLLIALASEYSLKTKSTWHPYLNLVPNNEDCPPPMLWSRLDRERLLGATCVDKLVDNDLRRIEDDFNNLVLPFMEKHPQYFSSEMKNLSEYHKLVSFVMSYSFTDGEADCVTSATMMVPFVDLLNHSSEHHAELTFHDQDLRLLAVRDINKGEEVMNTFGALPNTSLLHTYGFTEFNNPNDIVLITSEQVKHVFLKTDDSLGKLTAHWDLVVSTDIVEEDYCVDRDGEPYPELLSLIRLLYLRKNKFESLVRKIKSESLRELALEDLSQEELCFSRRLTDYRLSLYPESYESLQPLVKQTGGIGMKAPERYALYLTIGQQECLRALKQEINKLTEQEVTCKESIKTL